MSASQLASLRAAFHAGLLVDALTKNADGVWSNADISSATSCLIADGIARRLKYEVEVTQKAAGQTLGSKFEHAIANFVEKAFSQVGHLRPGTWFYLPSGTRPLGTRGSEPAPKLSIEGYEQFAHLERLNEIASTNPEVASALGNAYLIKADILIAREPVPDTVINSHGEFVDESVARWTPLRLSNNKRLILHALISCKWTLRSDRAQNTRTEALNLIRNRKGRVPHIVHVTAEPLPSRLASIALGTGDLDCVYHFALHELVESVSELEKEGDAKQNLENLIQGNRLKDISDLPLDLAI